jgi:hypothetical protein
VITFSTLTPTRLMDAGFVGFSYDKDELTTDNFNVSGGLKNLYNLLGSKNNIRVGGNSVNRGLYNVGNAGYAGGVTNFDGSPYQIAPSDIDRLAAFATATNSTVLYSMSNYAHGWSDQTSNTNEAAYAVSKMGAKVSFSVGNEAEFGSGNITNAQHIALYNAIQTAVGRSDIGYFGVDTSFGPSHGTQFDYGGYVGQFANDLSVATRGNGQPILSFMTKHFYPVPTNSQTYDIAQQDLDGSSGSGNLLAIVANPGLVASGTNPSSTLPPLPQGLRMSEIGNAYWNSYGTGNNWNSALWLIRVTALYSVFPAISGLNVHGGEGPVSTDPAINSSDYQLISTNDYQPGAGFGTTVVRAEAGFYAALGISRMLPGNLLKLTVNSGGGNLTTFGTVQVDGTYKLALLNGDTVNPLVVTVTLPGSVGSASTLLATAPSLTSISGFTLGGSAIGADASWNPSPAPLTVYNSNQLSVTIPASSCQFVTAK